MGVHANVRLWAVEAARWAFAVVGVALLWLVEPFWRIRIGKLVDHRLGHQCLNTDLVFRRRQMAGGRPPRTSYLFLSNNGTPANAALMEMWRRHMTIVAWRPLLSLSQRLLTLLRGSRFWVPVTGGATEAKEFALAAPTLALSGADVERGHAGLRRMGMGPEDWYVCFSNRDSAYLNTLAAKDWSYHAYRDSSIGSLSLSCERVAEMGGFAVRMGSVVREPLVSDNPRVIDYASKYHDPFMDIYLSARCRFFVGNGHGLHQLPLLFDVPLLYVNYPILNTMLYGKSSLFMPKLMRHKGESRLLSFEELRQLGAFERTPDVSAGVWHRDHGLEMLENSPEDIWAACQDMFAMLDGHPPEAEAVRLQRLYKQRFFDFDPDYARYAPDLVPSFALKYRGLIEA